MGLRADSESDSESESESESELIAKTGLLLSRGREDFPDFDSSVLRLNLKSKPVLARLPLAAG